MTRKERDAQLRTLGRLAYELADGAGACHSFYELAALAFAAKAYIDAAKDRADEEILSCLAYLLGQKADECAAELEGAE